MGWVENSLDASVAPCYSRNRAFRGIWWLIQRLYCNIKVSFMKTTPLNAPEAGITELFVKEDSAVATVWEVLIVAQNQRHIFLLLFWQSAVIVDALSCMMCVGGALLSFSFCIICLRALWLVSRRSKPAFPSIVFINEVSLLTPSDSPWTSIYWNLCCDLCRGNTVLRRSALS